MENVLGVVLPECCRAAYLAHDGCRDEARSDGCTPSFFVAINAHWNSLSDLVSAWTTRAAIVEYTRNDWAKQPQFEFSSEGLKIRQDWWNGCAVPIGSTWSDRELLVDLQPGPTGTAGQLMEFAYEFVDLEDAYVIPPSLDDYLLLFVERLEQDIIAYEAGRSWINTRTGETIANWATLEGF